MTDAHSITALHYPPAAAALATIVLGHGAGASQTSPFMTGVATGLSARGLHVVTFNFLYTERERRLPDPQPVLESCYRAVLQHVADCPRPLPQPLFIGGKSMGGRIASHVAAEPDADTRAPASWRPRLRGLVFLGYPLHPPARPQQVRVSHLASISHPMLFVQGERDAFGTPEELRPFLDVLPARCTLHVVERAGHSLEVPRRHAVPQAAVDASVQDTVVAWIRQLV